MATKKVEEAGKKVAGLEELENKGLGEGLAGFTRETYLTWKSRGKKKPMPSGTCLRQLSDG